ncbi:MAG: universal stress protein [Gammaproteobacteria bacterium]
MTKILIAVDGSDNSNRAVQYVIAMAQRNIPLELHILNVEAPAIHYGEIDVYVGKDKLEKMQREAGERALQPARALLDAAGVPYQAHVFIGEAGKSIAEQASQLGCDEIVMGTRGLGALSTLLLGSVATKVIHHAHVPVTLVK